MQPGDLMPFFKISRIDGSAVDYRNIWQRRNLLLVLVPAGEPKWAAYVAQLSPRASDLAAHDTEFIVTCDRVPGAPSPGIVVADRWGEIFYVGATEAGSLPSPDELIEWLRYVQHQCPECQGEAR